MRAIRSNERGELGPHIAASILYVCVSESMGLHAREFLADAALLSSRKPASRVLASTIIFLGRI